MSVAPTARAIIAVAAAAPFALVVGVVVPYYWSIGLVWVAFILCATAVDGLLGAARNVIWSTSQPRAACVGERFCVSITASFPSSAQVREVRVATQVSLEVDPGRLLSAPLRFIAPTQAQGEFWLTPSRRGQAMIERIWLRWTGPLGLLAQQRSAVAGDVTTITPDIRPLRSEGVRLFQRDALQGLIAQLERGSGNEFESLTEFQAGMDRRAMDWKASARHRSLLAKHYRAERDNQIVFAIDSGRAMSEPLDGIARVDRAVSSALLAAWAALKLGDRVCLYSFDSRPRVRTGVLSGIESFPVVQHRAAAIDYSSEETNHIFALSNLSQQLTRRSLIVLFTDFTDPTGADLMVRATGWLLKRHVVLFVILRDQDLDSYATATPQTIEDVARAVTAAALLNERRAVIMRLRRLGLEVLEAHHDQLNLDLIAHYIKLKQMGRL